MGAEGEHEPVAANPPRSSAASAEAGTASAIAHLPPGVVPPSLAPGVAAVIGNQAMARLVQRHGRTGTVAPMNRATPPRAQPGGRVIARRPVAMVQPGYATGDMFGIAAALIGDDELHVYISKLAEGADPDPRDRADMMADFYRASGIPGDRIHIVPLARLGDYDSLQEAARRRSPAFFRVFGVGHGTEYVAKHFSAELRTRIRTAWGLNVRRDAEIRAWLQAKGIATPAVRAGTRVLVLWSRFSGKRGEIHIEHDTSYEGIRQIVNRAKGHYTAVIITGDKAWGPRHANKYAQLANAANAGLPAPKVFDLTEFWRGGGPQLSAWGGDTRLGQLKLFDYLHRHFGLVKHLGFRSGNLEALALLGFQVRYMEEPGSEGSERMAKWHARGDTGRTALGGLAPGYERLQVEGPPTRSGQYALYWHQKRPAWAPGRVGAAAKPTGIGDPRYYGKGFTVNDLRAIAGYLGVPA